MLLLCGIASSLFAPFLPSKEQPPATAEPADASPRVELRHRLGAALLLGPGFALGLVVLARVIPPGMRDGWPHLVAAGTVPALLAAIVGGWSIHGRTSAQIGMRAFGAGLFAGGTCAPLTYLALAAVGAVHFDVDELLAVSVFGGAIGMPIGLALGLPFAAAVAVCSRLSRGVLAPAFERAWLGAVWLAAGVLAVAVSLVEPKADVPFIVESSLEALSGSILVAALVVMVIGVAIAGLSGTRVIRAYRFLSRARRGRLDEYAVVAPSALDADEATIAALPAYLPFGRLDAVLVRRLDPAHAPFRDATVSELLARVPGGPERRAQRSTESLSR